MSTGREEKFDAVVIGGGQSGLAAGYYLARLGLNFVILDANRRSGDSWRTRWDSLKVFTSASLNGLPGLRFPGSARSYPAKDEIAEFLEEYARRLHLPVRNGIKVDRLRKESDEYIVEAGNVRYIAANVIVATGAFSTPRIPSFAGEIDPRITQLHSCEYRNPSQLREGPVLIVGAGNSGAEIALELSRSSHEALLSGRDTGVEFPFRIGSVADRLLTPIIWFAFHRVLTSGTVAGRTFRKKVVAMGGHPLARVKPKDLAEAGILRVPKTTGVRDGYPALEDGRIIRVPNIVWCTGFRPDFGWIDLPVFDGDGFPVHDRGVVPSHPGLYFAGLFFLHSLTSSLIGGVGRDTRYIARHIARNRTNAFITEPTKGRKNRNENKSTTHTNKEVINVHY